jgi:hypothetical protein
MYAAKTGGRNRVQHTPAEPSSDQPEEQLSEQPIAIDKQMSA